MYRTEAPIMALWHMGRGEQPSLMMDPANCSPVQVSGTWYLLPKMKKKNNNPQLLPHPFLMAVVCLCIRCNSEGGEYHTPAVSPGCWIWLRACPQPSSIQLGQRGWGCIRLSLPQLRDSQGGKLQQHTPEVHADRPGRRCSTLVPCGV